MATVDDVEVAMVGALGRLLFPSAAYAMGAVATASVPVSGYPGAATIDVPLRMYVGAPAENELTQDIRNGVTNIVVSREKGMSRNTTRFAPYRRRVSAYAPTLTLAPAPGGFVVGGAAGVAQIVVALVAGVWYAYAASATDTPADVAAAMGAEIPGATVSGVFVGAQNVGTLNVGVYQREIEITGTTEEVVNVAVLAVPNGSTAGPIVREAVCRAVEGLKSLRSESGLLHRLALADGTLARVLAHDEINDDTPRREDVWRRWYGFRCEFMIGTMEYLPVMLAPLLVANLSGRIVWIGNSAPVANILTINDLPVSNGGNTALGTY